MAQVVGYWQDNVTYTEGPFVVCGAPIGGSRRIECEEKGHFCPVVVQPSIYRLLEARMPNFRSQRCEAVDLLNELVRKGEIIERDRLWVAPEYEEKPCCK
jgi:hypothetical protein